MKAIALLLVLTAAILAPAQDALREINKLTWMAGAWQGPGTLIQGPKETKAFMEVKDVQQKMNGTVLVLDGIGVDKDAPEKVIHETFAVLSYDATAKKLVLKVYLTDGSITDAKVAVAEKQLTYSIMVSGLEIRTTIKLDEKGQWVEQSEISQDKGKTFFKISEMTLTKMDL